MGWKDIFDMSTAAELGIRAAQPSSSSASIAALRRHLDARLDEALEAIRANDAAADQERAALLSRLSALESRVEELESRLAGLAP